MGPGWCGSVDWSAVPQNEGSLVQFLVRAPAWVTGSVPSWGAYKRQPHIDVSLPLFLHPFPSVYK